MGLLVLVLSIAVVGAGCGGQSDGDSDSSAAAAASPISKAEFVKQASGICQRARAGLTERVSDFERLRAGRKPEPYADVVHFVYLPTIEDQLSKIYTLNIPAGETGKIDAMLDAERDAIDKVAVRPVVTSIAAAEKHFGEPDRLFRAYGLPACAT